jgi:hypothetical protein
MSPSRQAGSFDPGHSNDFCRQAGIVGVGPNAVRCYTEATDASFTSNADSSPPRELRHAGGRLANSRPHLPLWAGAAFQGFLARSEDVDSSGNCKTAPTTPARAVVRLYLIRLSNPLRQAVGDQFGG